MAIIERAKAERRSISQETIVLLEKALALSEGIPTRRKLVLDEIAQEPPLEVMDIPDPVTFVREDLTSVFLALWKILWEYGRLPATAVIGIAAIRPILPAKA